MTFGAMVAWCVGGCETGGEPLGAVASKAAAAGLHATLEADLTEVAAGEPVIIRVGVHNPGSRSRPFLPINTALETPLQANAFEVLLEGEPQPYLGIVAQRLPVTAQDVIVLAPGERIEQSLDLSAHYRMDHPGLYQVSYTPKALTVGPDLGVEPAPVAVEGAVLSITRR